MSKARAGPISVVVMGLGFIGREIAKAAQASSELKLIGAVDSNPALVARSLGELMGDRTIEIEVSRDLDGAFGRARGGVVLHATGSRFPEVLEQLLAAVHAGASVVSTCEELAFTYLKYPKLATQLDQAAEKSGVSVLGTGAHSGLVLGPLSAAAWPAGCPVQPGRAAP